MSIMRRFQVLLAVAVLAAPAGLALTWFVPPAWSNVSAIAGLSITLLSVFAMALLRCPNCHHQLGLAEAAREFQSEFHAHSCPHCGADLRK